jgi:uncharacterized protein YjbI with pentapeptide repeats
MAINVDPYDVDSLERSVNDSGVRVSTIWVTFLGLGLYLVVAVGGVTHRQLLLGEQIKLPVLNVDLPLVHFFLVAPALFVIFHVYVLVQVLLLCRTAAAYNEAVEHSIAVARDRARVRQRLANTLFAQIFAGSPREREGLLGALLRLMARATLVIGPVVVLLIFEVKFLPYQDRLVTLVHRVLIFADLGMILLLWYGIFQASHDISWRVFARPSIALFIAIALALFSWLGLNYLGEPHASWMRAGECGHLLFSDRLELPWVDVVDDDKLAKMESSASVKGLSASQGERTHDFARRQFRCANFYRADFRRVDLTDANLRRANLAYAELQGATLSGADLWGAQLEGAQMQGADLSSVRNRTLGEAGYSVQFESGADLRHASLKGAELQGARLTLANMSGADLTFVNLQGAGLFAALLNGADLRWAQMQGADLSRASLRGANLSLANMKGANLSAAHLEGARFDDSSSFTLALVRHAYLWRATGAKCADAQITEPQLDLMVGPREDERKATAGEQEREIDDWFGDLEEEKIAEFRKRLFGDAEHDPETTDVWLVCETKALTERDYEKKHADYLVELACDTTPSQKYVTYGIYSNWVEVSADPSEILSSLIFEHLSDAHGQAVVHGLLGPDGKGCPGVKELGDRAVKLLQEFARGSMRPRWVRD